MTLSDNRRAALDRMPVSRETLARLDIYVDMLCRWQHVKNLVAPSTLDQIWTRHILDSAQLLPLLGNARQIIDFGSGAGFPGLVVAIANSEVSEFCVHLVESNSRKAAFLREVARATGASAKIYPMRIETFALSHQFKADLLTARALAPLLTLIEMGADYFARGARALFLKGQDVDNELSHASKYWNIDANMIQSITEPAGRIIAIECAMRRQPVDVLKIPPQGDKP